MNSQRMPARQARQLEAGRPGQETRIVKALPSRRAFIRTTGEALLGTAAAPLLSVLGEKRAEAQEGTPDIPKIGLAQMRTYFEQERVPIKLKEGKAATAGPNMLLAEEVTTPRHREVFRISSADGEFTEDFSAPLYLVPISGQLKDDYKPAPPSVSDWEKWYWGNVFFIPKNQPERTFGPFFEKNPILRRPFFDSGNGMLVIVTKNRTLDVEIANIFHFSRRWDIHEHTREADDCAFDPRIEIKRNIRPGEKCRYDYHANKIMENGVCTIYDRLMVGIISREIRDRRVRLGDYYLSYLTRGDAVRFLFRNRGGGEEAMEKYVRPGTFSGVMKDTDIFMSGKMADFSGEEMIIMADPDTLNVFYKYAGWKRLLGIPLTGDSEGGFKRRVVAGYKTTESGFEVLVVPYAPKAGEPVLKVNVLSKKDITTVDELLAPTYTKEWLVCE